MGLSIYNIKKWIKMFAGKSVLHVSQGIGQVFEPRTISGYFNDMTQKVLMQPEYIESEKLPTVKTEKGEDVLFPVAVFQYGLGCWDLFLLTKDEKYKHKFLSCATWALHEQQGKGEWNNFFFAYPEHPYGAMAQGEGASLLVRAWLITQDEKYINGATKALDFMLCPVEDGGTAVYANGGIVLLEYTHLSAVLNGWIFSLMGLYDVAVGAEMQEYMIAFQKSLKTLEEYLPKFERGYWSNYDLDKHIASPFYHHLHIAQMMALYNVTETNVFKEYGQKWEAEEKNCLKKYTATAVKGLQKIFS